MSSMNIETSISPNRSSPIKVNGTNQHQQYSYLPTNNNASSSPYVGSSFFSRYINKNRLLCLTMTSRRWFLTGICLILIIMSWAIQKETSIILYNSSEEDNDNKLFTPIPSMAPTPTGPCDPENPDTQPCRHAIFGRCIERIECTGRNMTIQEELQQPKNKLHINGTDVEHEQRDKYD